MGLQKGWINSYEDLWCPLNAPKITKDMVKAFGGTHPAPKAKEKAKAKAKAVPKAAPSASSSSLARCSNDGAAPGEGEGARQAVAGLESEPSNVRQGTVNTLHVVLRLLASEDEEVKGRLALMVAKAVRFAHKRGIKSLRSVDQVRSYYASITAWGFMDELKGVVDSLRDLAGMKRLGMTIDFAPSLADMSLEDPRIVNDDSIAAMIWRLTKNVLKFRALTCLWFVSSCPGVWGGFLSDSESERGGAMTTFKQMWETYTICKASHLPSLSGAAEKHPCDNRAAQDMARLCRSSGWHVESRVAAHAKLIFEGIGQENFLENAMRACRGVEVRQGTSKLNRTFRYWEAVHTSAAFAGSQRVETQPDGLHSAIPPSLLGTIFQPGRRPTTWRCL